MMKFLPLLFGCAVLLSGCTDADWNHLLGYGDVTRSEETQSSAASQPVSASEATTATQPPSSVTSQAPDTGFCRDVATEDATSNDFDVATQQRVFSQSYAQCLAIYTR